nr:rhodanese-like domain-containing protein [Advenella kashmirensis]
MDFLFYQNSIYFLIFLLVSGALLAFPLLRKQGKGNTGLSVKDAVNLVNRENAVFVDVRPVDSYRSGSIPSARNLPAATLNRKPVPCRVTNH